MNLTKTYASFYNAPNQFSENKARGGTASYAPEYEFGKQKKSHRVGNSFSE